MIAKKLKPEFNTWINISMDYGGKVIGAGSGFKAIQQIAQHHNMIFENLFDNIYDFNKFFNEKFKNQNDKSKFIKPIFEKYRQIIEDTLSIKQNIYSNSFVYITSGDHSNAIPNLISFRKNFSDKKLGIIWLDAHADLHNPYTTPSGNLHGMPLGLFYNDSNPKNENNSLWSDFVNQYQTLSCFKPEHLVFLGLRDFEAEENLIIKNKNISTFSVEDYRKLKHQKVLNKIQEQLKDCDYVYLSFDLDAIDSKIIKGIGSPVEGGFTIAETDLIIKSLFEKLPIKVFEVCELNPLLDEENNTAKLIFPTLEEILS